MEKLNEKTRIIGFLQRLMEKRVLLAIKLDGHQQPFTSAIIKIDSEQSFITLDELKPEEGDNYLRESPSLHISAQIDGVYIAFTTSITEFGIEDDIPFYKLSIPDEVDYHQRRQAVRIKLSAANPLPVTFTTQDGKSYDGEIDDLSLGGLRARFKKNLPDSLDINQQLNCSFLLPPDREKLNSEFIIRVIRHEADHVKPAFLGGQFLGMQKPLERQLQRAIMTLQRALQQKKSI